MIRGPIFILAGIFSVVLLGVSGISQEANAGISEQPGMLKIVKNTIGGDDTFNFESDVPGLGNFSILTSGGTGMSLEVDAFGIFNVTEFEPPLWNILNATCNDGSPIDAINVTAGEFVTCTFWNGKEPAQPTISTQSNVTGTITLFDTFDVKDTAILSGGFSPTGHLNFTLFKSSDTPDCTDASQKIHSELTLVNGNGDYMSSAVEINSAGNYSWLATYSGDGNNTAVTLPPNFEGNVVNCNEDSESFSVEDPGMLKIVKNTIGGDDTFDFESNVPGLGNFPIVTSGGTGMTLKHNVTQGIYSVEEIPRINWSLVNATCNDGSPINAVNVTAGEFVTCTFWNELNPSQATDALIEIISSEELSNNVSNSLTGPLKKVSKILKDNNPDNDQAACDKLTGFLDNLNAKADKIDDPDLVEELEDAAIEIKNSIGCPA